MKRLLAALVALVLAVPAQATTYHVRATGGSANNSGQTFGAAWTMAKANSALLPGDVCYVWNGTYTNTNYPNPDSAGHNPTGGGYITFIGANPSGDCLTTPSLRATVSIPGHTVGKPYLRLKGMRVAGTLTLNDSADRDSIYLVDADGDLQVQGCDYTVISSCAFGGVRGQISRVGGRSVRDTITDCHFPNLGNGITGNQENIFLFGVSTGAGIPDSLYFARNYRHVRMEPTSNDTHPQVYYFMRDSKIYDNRLDIEFLSTVNGNLQYAMRLRDSTYRNVWKRDTIIATGGGTGGKIFLNQDGAINTDQTVFGNTIDSCLWNLSALNLSYLQFGEGMTNYRITRSVIAMNGAALETDFMAGRNVIDHNTFVGSAGAGQAGGVLRFNQSGTRNLMGDTCLTFTNNIVYAIPPAYPDRPASSFSTCGGSPCPEGTWHSAIQFATRAQIDSSHALRQQNNLIANNNLYSYYGWGASPGDRSIMVGWPEHDTFISKPGDSTATNSAHWENTYRVDSLSAYGSPLFADSSRGISFDPTLRIGSRATGLGSGSTDAGARSYGAQPDVHIAPSQITFQFGVPETVLVNVTNVGDGTLYFGGANGDPLRTPPVFAGGPSGVSIRGTTDPTVPWYDGSTGPDVVAAGDPTSFYVVYDGLGSGSLICYFVVNITGTQPSPGKGQPQDTTGPVGDGVTISSGYAAIPIAIH